MSSVSTVRFVTIALSVLALSVMIASPALSATITYYVAVDGNDSWSGRSPSPSRNGADGPFKTIAHAQLAVRTGASSDTVNVEIRGGTYYLTEPLTFIPDDSGTPTKPITYEAYKKEKPIISGGIRISNWHEGADGRWLTSLPDVKAGAWNFEQLFVNDNRRYRPRLPHTGYYYFDGDLPPSASATGKGYDQVLCPEGSVNGSWQNLKDVEVLGFHIWSMARMRVKTVDPDSRTVTFTGTTPGTDYWTKFAKGNRFLVENVREALSYPGEWYLDRPTGQLTYIPQVGETPADATVVAPKINQLLILSGDPANHRWVHDLLFRGLSFECTNYVTPPEGHDFPQSDVDIPAAIAFTGARNCTLLNCSVARTGGYGISLSTGSQGDTIASCRLSDLGAGGIKIGDMDIKSDPEQRVSGNRVSGNDLFGGGRLFPAGTAIWIAQSGGNSISNNRIHDFYYTAISLGWTWGYGDSLSQNNTIADNDIFQIGQGVLSDMGGIYSVGARAGTVENHNRIHDIVSYSYGGWGIYFDEGSSNVVATNNLVYRTSHSGFHQHYGANNVVKNNIFAFGSQAQIVRTRAEDHLSFTLQHNIALSSGPPILGSNWDGNQFDLDFNDYWIIGGAPVTLNGSSLTAWQAAGHDVHSIVADPGFRDPSTGDFDIENPTTVNKIGFVPFDVQHFGPRKVFDDPPMPPAFPVLSAPALKQ